MGDVYQFKTSSLKLMVTYDDMRCFYSFRRCTRTESMCTGVWQLVTLCHKNKMSDIKVEQYNNKMKLFATIFDIKLVK